MRETTKRMGRQRRSGGGGERGSAWQPGAGGGGAGGRIRWRLSARLVRTKYTPRTHQAASGRTKYGTKHGIGLLGAKAWCARGGRRSPTSRLGTWVRAGARFAHTHAETNRAQRPAPRLRAPFRDSVVPGRQSSGASWPTEFLALPSLLHSFSVVIACPTGGAPRQLCRQSLAKP